MITKIFNSHTNTNMSPRNLTIYKNLMIFTLNYFSGLFFFRNYQAFELPFLLLKLIMCISVKELGEKEIMTHILVPGIAIYQAFF